MPGSGALPARPPWPPRIPASGSPLSPAHHQVDALQHPDRDDPGDAARSPDPVVDDHRRGRGPFVNGSAIAHEGERNYEKIVIGACGLRITRVNEINLGNVTAAPKLTAETRRRRGR